MKLFQNESERKQETFGNDGVSRVNLRLRTQAWFSPSPHSNDNYAGPPSPACVAAQLQIIWRVKQNLLVVKHLYQQRRTDCMLQMVRGPKGGL